ncbi:MAG: hypothetical protein WD794_10870 [Mycobacteriales bacterium]
MYDIPGAATGWIMSVPAEHIDWVNEINRQSGISGGAKKLARLLKAWRYHNNVPVSSFYAADRYRLTAHVAAQISQPWPTFRGGYPGEAEAALIDAVFDPHPVRQLGAVAGQRWRRRMRRT